MSLSPIFYFITAVSGCTAIAVVANLIYEAVTAPQRAHAKTEDANHAN